MAKPSQVIVLVEDNRQQQLVCHYLRRIGLEARAIRFAPPSAGSGEQWVREQFPVEVSAYRRRSASVETRLIAVIDGDNLTLQARLSQLDQKLREEGIELIRAGEQIARLIPRRNVETWILCLNRADVNEEDDYKRQRHQWTNKIRPAAEQFYDWTRPNSRVPDNCIPSLQHGVAELTRLDLRAT